MTYAERPWLALYDRGQPADTKQEYANALEMFKASVRRAGDRRCCSTSTARARSPRWTG